MAPKQLILQSLKNNFGVSPEILLNNAKNYLPVFHSKKLLRAFEFAVEAHDGQLRKSGDPYIIHPFETALILLSLHVDEDTLIASLLHDIPEDTKYSIEDISKKFGKNVAYLVKGITKLSKVHYQNDMARRQVESLKNLFIHSAKDPRVILIKLADRLHNMRTLHFIDKPEKRMRISRETLEIFVPIANLLGIEELKVELEDLCFRNIYPEDYELISGRMKINREKNKNIQDKIIQSLNNKFKKQNISASIYGRVRNLFSIYKEITGDITRLKEYDNNIALRIIVGEKDDCYKVLGILHSLFKPKPGEFKDYIAVPKRNGYQSLHTSVFGQNGISIDFQIRTHKMHLESEYGVAARYFHKNSKKKARINQDNRASWATKILKLQYDAETDDTGEKFINDLKDDIFHDRIFIFTPKGDSIDLPQGATCIDLAYEIHTEVGHRAIKADVNGSLVPLTTKLQNRDTVNIITSDIPRAPKRVWLDFVKTNLAKNRILEYFKRISREEKLKTGAMLLQKELDRAGLGLLKDIPQKKKQQFSDKYKKYRVFDDVLVAIGEGMIRPLTFINTLYPSKDVPKHGETAKTDPLAKSTYTHVSIKIISHYSGWQLKKIFGVLSDLKINSLKIKSYISLFKKDLICYLNVCVHNYAQVSQLCENLEQIDGIKSVSRISWRRSVLFTIGSVLTFMIWIAHPYILFSATHQLEKIDPRISDIMIYVGLLMLFMIVYLGKRFTHRSYPELRETVVIWAVTLLLSIFAVVTLFAEIYFFELSYNWILVLAMILLFSMYLTSEYVKYKERIK
jgi:guanosine-3',5'-bis(diphosphate) 3'-pyrophosphohydrolase